MCGLLLNGCLICAVPRCTRSGAGVSIHVTDLVTPGRLGKMRLEERVAARRRVDALKNPRTVSCGDLINFLQNFRPFVCCFWVLRHFNYIVCKARGDGYLCLVA